MTLKKKISKSEKYSAKNKKKRSIISKGRISSGKKRKSFSSGSQKGKNISRFGRKSAGKSKKKRLTRKELKEFKKILLDLQEEIIKEINHINQEARNDFKDSSGDISSHTFHMADIADESFAKELNLELVSNEREILRAINQSLHRIETGEYGICFDCHRLIPKSRLRVIPYTLLCRKCQEEREKKVGNS